MLKSFSQDDRDHMVEDGRISVTCEFCSANLPVRAGRGRRQGELIAPALRRPFISRVSRDPDRAWCCVPAYRGDDRCARSFFVVLSALAGDRAGAKLSGAAGVRAPAGAGHRAHHEQRSARLAALRARFAGGAMARARRAGERAGRPPRHRLGLRLPPLRAARRADQDRRRQAHAGRLLCDRPQLRLRAVKRPGYLRIESGTVCVDDPRSPAYNTITGRAKVGWKVHGETMRRVPAYRRGLLVDYPTDRAARAGSCVFIHLRLPGKIGTVRLCRAGRAAAHGRAGFRAGKGGAGRSIQAGARAFQGVSALEVRVPGAAQLQRCAAARDRYNSDLVWPRISGAPLRFASCCVASGAPACQLIVRSA